jgi:hypothetical protein
MGISREQLYEEVWAEPMTKVAERYGTFSTRLAKICRQLNVPRPPRGYWAKLRVGKKPRRPPLPEALPGDELEWVRGWQDRRTALPLPEAPRRTKKPAVLPSRHPVLDGAQRYFDEAQMTEEGYLRPAKQSMVDLFVSKEVLPRALETANELFLLLEGRGHRVVLAPRDVVYRRVSTDHRERKGRELSPRETWCPLRPTITFVGGVAFGLTLFELAEEVEFRYVNGKYIPVKDLPVSKRRWTVPSYEWTTKRDRPCGRLCLKAYSPYPLAEWGQLWSEKAPGELSGQLPALIRTLEREAATVVALVEEGKRKAEEEMKRWEAQKRQWEQERIEKERAEAIKESREEFLSIVGRWAHARNHEGFFEDVERRAADLEDDERAVVIAKLRRAREMFGGTDALRHFRSWKTPEERS